MEKSNWYPHAEPRRRKAYLKQYVPDRTHPAPAHQDARPFPRGRVASLPAWLREPGSQVRRPRACEVERHLIDLAREETPSLGSSRVTGSNRRVQ
jgi:hypothetical protein